MGTLERGGVFGDGERNRFLKEIEGEMKTENRQRERERERVRERGMTKKDKARI